MAKEKIITFFQLVAIRIFFVDSKSTAIPPALNQKMVNFGPLTNKLQARMLTHLKSTMRVLRLLLHLTSGYVTLLPGKFYHPP